MHSGFNVSHSLGPHVAAPRTETLLLAGATGVLANEVLRRVAGSGRFGHTHVLAQEPVLAGMGRVTLACITNGPVEQWPLIPAEVGVVMVMPHAQRTLPTPLHWPCSMRRRAFLSLRMTCCGSRSRKV